MLPCFPVQWTVVANQQLVTIPKSELPLASSRHGGRPGNHRSPQRLPMSTCQKSRSTELGGPAMLHTGCVGGTPACFIHCRSYRIREPGF